MEPKPNFQWRELGIFFLLALASSAVDQNIVKPLMVWLIHQQGSGLVGLLRNLAAVDMRWWGLRQPASGMALFGGILFVFWAFLGHQIIRKKYSALVTCIFLGSIGWIMNPGFPLAEYGITCHMINMTRFCGIVMMGLLIELTIHRTFWLRILGGALGNLACVVITWLALGFDVLMLAVPKVTPFIIPCAVISGAAGVFLLYGVSPIIRTFRSKFKKIS